MGFKEWLNDQKKNLGESVDWLSDKIKEQKKNAEESIMKVTNKEFMQAIVAGCALIAAADGNLELSEKEKMVEFMKGSTIMRLYDMSEVVGEFNKYADVVIADYNAGKKECIDAILKVRYSKDETTQVVRFCSIIASADGSVSEKEEAIIKELAVTLELDPKEFGF
ncbi:tellurite resistance TerB family protein [Clostridium sp. PL3]|uniref:Tellurite resistance TerB family protein n=1 Tax=Clostridium thailandense TaxID=2794346 RepID=A0A949WQA5_9CLOT|nr:TerB family tellurite resistance protein [Clostridium thailandense]MBV7272480.1 tellurite resistance TerB family protein [Clostridium thailandense]